MNGSGIKVEDVANGLGVRTSVFVNEAFKECFNYRNKFTQESINTIIKRLDKPYISGLSLLGGEPLDYQNQEGLLPLLRQVKAKHPEKDIWCYTKYKFDEDVIGKMLKSNPYTKEFMSYIDVIVDRKLSSEMQPEDTTNQRIIDVKQSLKANKIVEIGL